MISFGAHDEHGFVAKSFEDILATLGSYARHEMWWGSSLFLGSCSMETLQRVFIYDVVCCMCQSSSVMYPVQIDPDMHHELCICLMCNYNYAPLFLVGLFFMIPSSLGLIWAIVT